MTQTIKFTTIGLGTLALTFGVLALGVSTTEAYRGDPTVLGPNYTVDRHEAMEATMEKNDYDAWKALMGDRGRVTTVVTAANFAKFSEAHELAEDGKIAEAQQIRESLGLGLANGSRQGGGSGADNMNRSTTRHDCVGTTN